jgi:AcrR family transcriptional regulator
MSDVNDQASRGGRRPSAPRTARERARAEITEEILKAARGYLATDGAPALSLRAIARDLGMASSALYRYFGSRDELLTRLIIDAYDSLGTAAEAGEAAAPPPGGVRRRPTGPTWPPASPPSARRSGPGHWPTRTSTR